MSQAIEVELTAKDIEQIRRNVISNVSNDLSERIVSRTNVTALVKKISDAIVVGKVVVPTDVINSGVKDLIRNAFDDADFSDDFMNKILNKFEKEVLSKITITV